MKIEARINCEVVMTYRDIDGLRTTDTYGARRTAEWTHITAKADVNDDGSLDTGVGRVWISGRGNYVKKDGTVGQATARMALGSLHSLPPEWQERILNDLLHLASHVNIVPVTAA